MLMIYQLINSILKYRIVNTQYCKYYVTTVSSRGYVYYDSL